MITVIMFIIFGVTGFKGVKQFFQSVGIISVFLKRSDLPQIKVSFQWRKASKALFLVKHFFEKSARDLWPKFEMSDRALIRESWTSYAGFNIQWYTAVSRKVVEKSARDNLERYCGWFLVHCFSKKFQRMARNSMDVCLRVLKESNKSRCDSYSVKNKCLDYIPYYLSGLSRALFFRPPFWKQLYITSKRLFSAVLFLLRTMPIFLLSGDVKRCPAS